MNIVIDQGGYQFQNLGDLAMLQVALRRVSGFWAHANISVITTSPERLRRYCYGAHALSPVGRSMAFGRGSLFGPAGRYVPHLEWTLTCKYHRWVYPLSRVRFRIRGRPRDEMDVFTRALRTADVVLVSGGGLVTDVFSGMVFNVSTVLMAAQAMGKPTAMFGQGLGPLSRPDLRRMFAPAAARLVVLGLREGTRGLELLRSMGVPTSHVTVTGDDAVELGYMLRSRELGNGLGVGLRMAGYAEAPCGIEEGITRVVANACRRFRCKVLPAPVSLHDNGEDARAIRIVARGVSDDCDGGAYIDTPEALIRSIGQCRVVLTGSYHAGVFALAQGVPVVGLVGSRYYADKFAGLAGQFKCGCQLVSYRDPDFEYVLADRICGLWKDAPVLRSRLLQAAEAQMSLSWAAYERFADLVNGVGLTRRPKRQYAAT